PKWEEPKVLLVAAASAIPLLLVFTVATFPGEWLDDNLPSVKFIPIAPIAPSRTFIPIVSDKYRVVSLYDVLVAGEVDLTSRKLKSLWSNRLVLPGLDLTDYGKVDSESRRAVRSHSTSQRSRHLEGAVLIGANLRRADFTGARLQGALLKDAHLEAASF